MVSVTWKIGGRFAGVFEESSFCNTGRYQISFFAEQVGRTSKFLVIDVHVFRRKNTPLTLGPG